MLHNVGSMDRIIRIVVGLGLLALLYLFEGNARWWGLIGIVPLLSGVLAYCPFYQAGGIDTIENKTATQ